MNLPPTTYRRGRTRPATNLTKNPIESYGPEMMAVLMRGAREKFIIRVYDKDGTPGRQRAMRAQVRMHSLRRLMAKAGHPDYNTVARCHVSVRYGDKVDEESRRLGCPATLTLFPKDSEFAEEFAAAGITARDLEGMDPLETPSMVPSGPTPPAYPDDDDLPDTDPLKKFFGDK